jgi:hypothetical protein
MRNRHSHLEPSQEAFPVRSVLISTPRAIPAAIPALLDEDGHG